MPVLKRGARQQVLSDALYHWCMAGDASVPSTGPGRLRGWPDMLQTPTDELAALWDAHRDGFDTPGFVAWGAILFDRATDTALSRTERARWSKSFYEQRGY